MSLEELTYEEIIILKYAYDFHSNQKDFIEEYKIINDELNKNYENTN